MTAERVSQAEETLNIVCLLSVFAMCVERASPKLVTAGESGYRLVALRTRAHTYELAVWRPEPLDEPESALIAVAKAPGVREARLSHVPDCPVPLDDIARRWMFAEVWGVRAHFRFPSSPDEVEALRRLAWL